MSEYLQQNQDVIRAYNELNKEQRKLVDKVLNMLGETMEDIDKITIGKNGGILLESGKPNIKKFIQMAMEMD